MDDRKDIDYKFWAGPSGRNVTARIWEYKRRVVKLYCIIGVLVATVGVLASYICNLLYGG